jgi:hypothetical protein
MVCGQLTVSMTASAAHALLRHEDGEHGANRTICSIMACTARSGLPGQSWLSMASWPATDTRAALPPCPGSADMQADASGCCSSASSPPSMVEGAADRMADRPASNAPLPANSSARSRNRTSRNLCGRYKAPQPDFSTLHTASTGEEAHEQLPICWQGQMQAWLEDRCTTTQQQQDKVSPALAGLVATAQRRRQAVACLHHH